MSCFESQEFAKGDPFDLTNIDLVYKGMIHDLKGKVYGKGIMAMALRDFQTWAIQLHKILKSPDGQQHKVWVVPAKLSSIRFFNYLQSVEGEFSGAQQDKEGLLT